MSRRFNRAIRIIFSFALAFVLIPHNQAHAGWSAMPGGSLGTSPDQVAQAWANFYNGSYTWKGAALDSSGRFSGLYYDINRSNGQLLPEVTSASCSSDPNGSNKDSQAPSGCSNTTEPQTKQIGDPPPWLACKCGDPINIIDGNMFTRVVDYQSAGPDVLSFVRVYNSLGQSFSSLGYGWQTNFDRRIIFDEGTPGFSTSVHIIRADGAEYHFVKSAGAWSSGDHDVDGTLTTDGATVWTFRGPDDITETYDYNTGKLKTIATRSGYTQNVQYDANGNLASVTDTYNRTLSFTFSNGVLQSMTDPDGRSYTYSYANLVLASPSLLTSVTYPGTAPNPKVQYLYESATYPGALTGIVDENGNRTSSWTYDSQKRAITDQRGTGADALTVSYNLNLSGFGTVTLTNALNKQTIYTIGFDSALPRLDKVAQQASANTPAATSTVSYDSNGYISQRVDNNGNTTNYVNDSHGNVTSKTEAAGTSIARTTTYSRLSGYHVPTQIVEPGRTTAFTYDSNPRVLTKTETDITTTSIPYSTNGRTRSWSYTYTSNGELATVTGPLNDLTTYGYDSSGALTSVTNVLNQVTQITRHDASGRPETIVDPNSVTTTLTYDSRGRLLTTSVATANGSPTTTIAYDLAGNVTQITQPDGSYLAYTYDDAHRLTEVTDAFGNTISYTLDALGDRALVDIATSGSTIVETQSRIFDDLGRLLKNIGAANQTTVFRYDTDNNLTNTTDPLSNQTTQSFDALNRLIKVAAPLSATTDYGYDTHNNRTSVTDPRGLETTYIYDGLDDLIETTSPDTGTTIYVADAAGNRTQRTDATGVVTNYAYDALSRLTAKTFPGDSAENITYTYDATNAGDGVGRLTSVADQSGSTSLTYDALGDVTQETRLIGGIQYVTTYTYDLAGHVTQETYPSGRIVNYTRDAMGHIASATTQQNAQSSAINIATGVSYEPFGPLAALTYGNGLALSITYDQDYQPTTRIVSGGATVQSLSYSFDGAGDLKILNDNVDNTRNQAFQYDALYRLTQASGTYGTYGYGYDADNNRTSISLTNNSNNFSATYAYAANSNQLQTITSGSAVRSISYTADGNTAQDNQGTGAVFGYSYNQDNRLVESQVNGGELATYTLNYLGQRVVKASDVTGSTDFSYDRGGHLIAESDSSGNILSEYIWLGDMPVAFVSANGIDYIQTDHLGTPQKMTAANQNVAWDGGASDPFLKGPLPTFSPAMNLRFPGQYFDAETGTHYNYFRDYDPSLGRYIESDPNGLGGGINTYGYVGNNPLAFTDPEGLQQIPPDVMVHILNAHGFNTMRTRPGNSVFLPWYSSPTALQQIVNDVFAKTVYPEVAHFGQGNILQVRSDQMVTDPQTGEEVPYMVGFDGNGNPTNRVLIRYDKTTGDVVSIFPIPTDGPQPWQEDDAPSGQGYNDDPSSVVPVDFPNPDGSSENPDDTSPPGIICDP